MASYRVIELIDRNYFQKPSYLKWNEVSIDEFNREGLVYAINKSKNLL